MAQAGTSRPMTDISISRGEGLVRLTVTAPSAETNDPRATRIVPDAAAGRPRLKRKKFGARASALGSGTVVAAARPLVAATLAVAGTCLASPVPVREAQ